MSTRTLLMALFALVVLSREVAGQCVSSELTGTH